VASAIKQFESGVYQPSAALPASVAAQPARLAPAQQREANEAKMTSGEIQRRSEIEKETAIAVGKAKVESDQKARIEFEKAIDPTYNSEVQQRARRMQDILTTNPNVAGVLAAPGMRNALAELAASGLTTPGGNIGVKGIEEAIAKANPKIDPALRREMAGYIASMQLDEAKAKMQGQGQISDSERGLIGRASADISDPAESLMKKAKMLEARARTQERIADLYGDGTKYLTNFTAFKNTPEYKAIAKEYDKELESILKEKIVIPGSTTYPGGKPAAVPTYSDAEKEKRYQDWKRSQK
jgi:hypothetical protein